MASYEPQIHTCIHHAHLISAAALFFFRMQFVAAPINWRQFGAPGLGSSVCFDNITDPTAWVALLSLGIWLFLGL